MQTDSSNVGITRDLETSAEIKGCIRMDMSEIPSTRGTSLNWLGIAQSV